MKRALFALPLLLLVASAPLVASGRTPKTAPAAKAHDHGHHDHAHGDHAHGDQEPTTLRVIMTGLRVQMIRVQEALWLEDYDSLATAARGLAAHAPISAEEQKRIETTLGKDYARFAEVDHALHDYATRLAEVAAAQDLDRTLKALSEVQAGCMACHTQFRPALLTAAPAAPATR